MWTSYFYTGKPEDVKLVDSLSKINPQERSQLYQLLMNNNFSENPPCEEWRKKLIYYLENLSAIQMMIQQEVYRKAMQEQIQHQKYWCTTTNSIYTNPYQAVSFSQFRNPFGNR